ncbi:MAG: YceI family protein [Acidobacteriota bacterium]|nr:YceI family protein [Acidobacteriota bacterium]
MSSASKALTFLLTALTVTLCLAAPTAEAKEVLTFEPESTEITFQLGATGHDVEGTLYLREGELVLDPESGEAAGRLVLDALRTETGNGSRDKTMHKKVLESDRHPLITFDAESFEGALDAGGESEIQLHGVVRLLGQPHAVTLPTRITVDGDRFQGSTSFPVPYVQWGLHDPSLFVLRVAKEVQVDVAAQGSAAHVSEQP